MNGRVGLLSALLALQLVIIGVVLLTGSGLGESEEGPFLDFEAAAVNEVRIASGGDDPASLTLARAEDGWRLPDGLPADSGKVADVLEDLEGLRSPWPVATSGGAAERFEVAEDNYQRHLTLLAEGEVVAELYLGTSPGYQQVHARQAGTDAVYSVGIANYRLPAAADEWLDKTLLQARGAITAVAWEGAWRLAKGDEGWLLGEAPADQEAAADLVRRLSELRVTGAVEPPGAEAEPDALLTVTDDEGEHRLTFVAFEEGNRYRVSSDRREGWFGVAGYSADQLLVDAQALQLADESAQDSPEGSRDGSARGAPAGTSGGSPDESPQAASEPSPEDPGSL